ncbi:hypothetical protein [Actinomadura sp. 7K507]|uniref:hypothetical protein n=1 Tax=Actinomadura sp. 7K507 TaxID=2530365 RepID=UPI001404B159|nr:hypothetical protein [Actinomadura sp. 7K507]
MSKTRSGRNGTLSPPVGTGRPIPGLYAAGNAMAAVIGPGIVSPGATIGSALTWGWIAGTRITS